MALLHEAAAYHKAGDKESARNSLARAAEINPQNELVWLWQASLARSAVEAMTAIERVLELNPENQKALGWKAKLASKVPAPPEPKAELNGTAATYAEEVEAVETEEAETVETEAESEPEEAVDTETEVQDEAEVVEEAAVEIETADEEVADDWIEEEVEASIEEEVEAAVDDGLEEEIADEEAVVVEVEEAVVEDSQGRTYDIDVDAESDADDVLRALESEGNPEEETASAMDLWERPEPDEEEEDSDAAMRALEALHEHVEESPDEKPILQPRTVQDDDDPIRRLLAEREGGVVEDKAETKETDWDAQSDDEQDSYDDEEHEGGADQEALLAMLTQDTPAASETQVTAEESEADETSALEEDDADEEEPAPYVPTHWSCLLCGQQSHRVEPYCPSCKSIGDITRIPDMARNEDVDRVALKRLIADWEDQSEIEQTAELCTKLALGYLNMRQSNSALPHLLAAARLDRSNDALASALEQVSRRPLILVVDDSRTVQRMVLSTLEREFFRVQIAEDGLQALAKLNEETPSMILLDITMPRMDGYQVCKIITGNESFKHIPVVMLSGKDGFFDKVRGRMVGAKDYITKPFEAEGLVKAVRKRVGESD